MWVFSGGGFLSRAPPLSLRLIVDFQALALSSLWVVSRLSLLWSCLWHALRFSGKREIELWLSSLPLMRTIGGGIWLKIVSFRGLGLGCFVGCSLSGRLWGCCFLYTPCVLGAPYAVFLIKLQLLIKKKSIKEIANIECHAPFSR